MSKSNKEPAKRVRLSLEAMAQGDGPPKGIRCPRCGGSLSRVDATRDGPDERRRYRICLHCQHRFRTDERL